MQQKIPLYLNGQFTPSQTSQWKDVTDPTNQEKLSQVPFATPQEMTQAVDSAQAAFQQWRQVPLPTRMRYFFKYQALLKQHQDKIARVLCAENGKNFIDGQGDVWRGIEVVEHACSAANHLMGETIANVAQHIDTFSYLQPMGVFAGITPFNFPAMIPLWMFPLAIVSGNTFVLKPSEQDPLTPTLLTELLHECGPARRRLQRRPRRGRTGGLLTHPSPHPRSLLCRLRPRGPTCLQNRHPTHETSSVLCRSQKPPGGHARCQ